MFRSAPSENNFYINKISILYSINIGVEIISIVVEIMNSVLKPNDLCLYWSMDNGGLEHLKALCLTCGLKETAVYLFIYR